VLRTAMDESFSRVGFLYGMAFVLSIGKACTLLIWRTLPKPRPPLRRELLEAWRHRRTHVRARRKAASAPQGLPPVDDEASTDGRRHENSYGPTTPASVGAPSEAMKPNE
jgi:hypothetical protein